MIAKSITQDTNEAQTQPGAKKYGLFGVGVGSMSSLPSTIIMNGLIGAGT